MIRRSLPLRLVAIAAFVSGCIRSPGVLPVPEEVQSASVRCSIDAEGAVRIIRADYAGFADRQLGSDPATLALIDSLLETTASLDDAAACSRAITQWIDTFQDPHVALSGARGAGPVPAGLPRRRQGDPGAPTFQIRPDGVALLRLPDFALGRQPAIDSVVAAARPALAATRNLIIDVRRNGGGWSGSYRSVLPLLYTAPIRVRGLDVWSSPDNLEAMRSGLKATNIPDVLREQIAEVVPRMEANSGRFVLLEPDAEVRLDSVLPLPLRIAVLIDRGCASSCEQFVEAASQSEKVTVLGREGTRGATDYGNVRMVRLPSGSRDLRVPIARWHRSDTTARGAGIQPDVRLQDDSADLVEVAATYLNGPP